MKRFPTRPISSLSAAKIKSDCASGMRPNFWRPLPYHCQNTHPHHTATMAFRVCRYQASFASSEPSLMYVPSLV